MQPRSITRSICLAATAAALCLMALASPAGAAGQHPPGGPAGAAGRDPRRGPAAWREAPEFVALFTPRPYRASYHAFVTATPLDEALRHVTADPASQHPPGAWTPRPQSPWDAFGEGGTWDRWKVARLYGSARPVVARGPRGTGDRPDEMWTLVSPYPSASLDRLEPGTLLLVLRVP
jgi:hypothetical protein